MGACIKFDSFVKDDKTGQLYMYRWMVSIGGSSPDRFQNGFPKEILPFVNALKEAMPYKCPNCQKRYKQGGVCRDHNRPDPITLIADPVDGRRRLVDRFIRESIRCVNS